MDGVNDGHVVCGVVGRFVLPIKVNNTKSPRMVQLRVEVDSKPVCFNIATNHPSAFINDGEYGLDGDDSDSRVNCAFEEVDEGTEGHPLTSTTFLTVVATRDILPGEELCLSYGNSYWKREVGKRRSSRGAVPPRSPEVDDDVDRDSGTDVDLGNSGRSGGKGGSKGRKRGRSRDSGKGVREVEGLGGQEQVTRPSKLRYIDDSAEGPPGEAVVISDEDCGVCQGGSVVDMTAMDSYIADKGEEWVVCEDCHAAIEDEVASRREASVSGAKRRKVRKSSRSSGRSTAATTATTTTATTTSTTNTTTTTTTTIVDSGSGGSSGSSSSKRSSSSSSSSNSGSDSLDTAAGVSGEGSQVEVEFVPGKTCLYGGLCNLKKDNVKPNKCENGKDCGKVHHHSCAWSLDKIDAMRCPYCNGGEKARAEVHFRQSLKSMKAPTTTRSDGSGQPTRRLRKLRKDPVPETDTSASSTKPAKKRKRVDRLAPHNASPPGKKAPGPKRL